MPGTRFFARCLFSAVPRNLPPSPPGPKPRPFQVGGGCGGGYAGAQARAARLRDAEPEHAGDLPVRRRRRGQALDAAVQGMNRLSKTNNDGDGGGGGGGLIAMTEYFVDDESRRNV